MEAQAPSDSEVDRKEEPVGEARMEEPVKETKVVKDEDCFDTKLARKIETAPRLHLELMCSRL